MHNENRNLPDIRPTSGRMDSRLDSYI